MWISSNKGNIREKIVHLVNKITWSGRKQFCENDTYLTILNQEALDPTRVKT